MNAETTAQRQSDLGPTHDMTIRITEPSQEPEPEAEAEPELMSESDISWSELLSFGTEQILKGTDTGTLVAFASLAFNGMRDKKAPHHGLGCSFLLFSLLMCAMVHFCIGNDYVGRAKRMLKDKPKVRHRHELAQRSWYWMTRIAAIIQILCLMAGLGLILREKPPMLVLKYLGPLLQSP